MKEDNILFLWDIDGTLITVGGAGERALVHAIKDCFGIDGDLAGIDYSGRTDRRISHMLHDYYKIEKTDASLESFLDSYLFHLEQEMKNTRMTVVDGVRAILDEIEANPRLHQGLLTGNLQRGAEIKLGHFGIGGYFKFGAFSNLSMNRNELAGHALDLAEKATGVRFMPEHTYIIGDTPHDIECGKSISAKTVAVAAGRFTAEELKAHHPDYTFEKFGDSLDFLEQVLSD